jgi:hypothetical protein
VSGETRERTEQLASEWKLDQLPLGYGLTEGQMRDWGLFVSHGIYDHEPALFSEPGLFLIASDGTVYYESILSMPAGLPRLDDLLGGFKYWREHNYSARERRTALSVRPPVFRRPDHRRSMGHARRCA